MGNLFRFPPPAIDPADRTFLTSEGEAFAKLKIESKAGKRTVFLTSYTLIFVLKGIKLLHFPDHTLEVSAGRIVLLKKGIYVMAEYMEQGSAFEALLVFLPLSLLRNHAVTSDSLLTPDADPYKVFRANELTDTFKHQVRQYFDKTLPLLDSLFGVKQQEILLLLMSSGYQAEVRKFIAATTGSGPDDLDFAIRNYIFTPVNLQDLAVLANRSLSSFKRDFQNQYHCAPKKWINTERLKQARLLLLNTDQRIAEIAAGCGFQSTSYFTRAFKKAHQCTPGEWRSESRIN